MNTDDAFKFIFATSGKARNMSSAKNKMMAASGGAPEVMAKITSFVGADGSAKSSIEYITRNGEVKAYDRFNVELNDDDLKEKRADYDQIHGRKAMKMMLSMPSGTEQIPFEQAVRETLDQEFGKHDYMYVFHNDTDNPHAHVIVPMVDEDGKRINPRKEDLMRYRETFATELERRGVLANATTTQQRKKGMLSKVFGKEANRKGPSKSTKEKVDVAWRLIKDAYIKAGDSEAVKLVNQLAPRGEKQIVLDDKGIELGD